MRCPRCLLADIPETTRMCLLCGYSPVAAPAGFAHAHAAAEADVTSPPTSPPFLPPPSVSPPPADAAASELDARRELSREFTLESVLDQRPGRLAYVAQDAEGRTVTVKAIPRLQPGDAAGEDRFFHAAEAAAALDHPHIVPLQRRGVTKSFLWYATKHVDGRSLEEELRAAGPIELPRCHRILEQVASALDHAHRRGVIHGALEPACVLIGENDWVLVDDVALSGPAVRGSPEPDAPAATPGADQRALAALAYACLTGASLPGQAPPALAEQRPDIPLHVSEALRRALSDRPGDRFPGVLDFVAALGGTRAAPSTAWSTRTPRRGPGAPVVIIDYEDEPPPRRTSRVAAAAVGFVIALGVCGAWLSMSPAPAPTLTSRVRGYSPPPTQSVDPPPPPAQRAPATEQRAPSIEQKAPEPRLPVEQPRTTASRPVPRAVPPVTRAPTRPRVPASRVPPASEAPRTAALAEPGRLSINSVPWGNVYIDEQPVGNTPQLDLPIMPGTHRLRVEREGFRPYERAIEVAPGQRLRITDIVLRDLVP